MFFVLRTSVVLSKCLERLDSAISYLGFAFNLLRASGERCCGEIGLSGGHNTNGQPLLVRLCPDCVFFREGAPLPAELRAEDLFLLDLTFQERSH